LGQSVQEVGKKNLGEILPTEGAGDGKEGKNLTKITGGDHCKNAGVGEGGGERGRLRVGTG